MFQQQPNQKNALKIYIDITPKRIKWPKSTQKDAQRH